MNSRPPLKALPAVPAVELLTRYAREVLASLLATKDPERSDLRLTDAQLLVAREYGCTGWPQLKRVVDSLASPGRTEIFVLDPSWYEARAKGLVEMHRGGLPNAIAQIRAWHPTFAKATDRDIAASPFTLDEAMTVYARQHGVPRWSSLLARVEAIKAQPLAGFAAAFAAIERQDVVTLATLVKKEPQLLEQRGTNGNTLVNLAVSLGRQDPGCVRALLAAGADPAIPNDRGWTPLHQARNVPMVELLLKAGAPVTISAHGDGGTPLAVALWSGRTAVAKRLAVVAIVPDNLRVNAGLNRVSALPVFFDRNGLRAGEAEKGRGFYRPHSGFPAWQPGSGSQETVDEALAWAARNDAIASADYLVSRGADVNSVVYRGTPLMHAVFNQRIATARWLLEHGAAVDQLAPFHGGEAGRVTALHLAAQTNNAPLLSLLLEHGASRTILDENYHADAAGWATYCNSADTLALLQP